MRVAIAGGHGQIALRLARILSQRGEEVVALIRNPGHAEDVRHAGAEPVVVDLEQQREVGRQPPLEGKGRINPEGTSSRTPPWCPGAAPG